MRDADLIAYLEGQDASGGAALDPEARAEVDRVRALLADSSVWAEPAPHLEGSVLAAVSAAVAATPAPEPVAHAQHERARRTRRAMIGGVLAVAAALALV